jgi:hypothetical protein
MIRSPLRSHQRRQRDDLTQSAALPSVRFPYAARQAVQLKRLLWTVDCGRLSSFEEGKVWH